MLGQNLNILFFKFKCLHFDSPINANKRQEAIDELTQKAEKRKMDEEYRHTDMMKKKNAVNMGTFGAIHQNRPVSHIAAP